MTKKQFFTRIAISILILFITFGYLWNIKFPHDKIDYDQIWTGEGKTGYETVIDGLIFGSLHIAVNFALIISAALFIIFTLNEATDSEGFKFKEPEETDRITKFKYNWLLWILPITFIFFGISFYSNAKFIYNRSTLYHNDYAQNVQEKAGFYDKMWKTYLQKEKLTNLNKETFIQVTALIMENRKDGQNLAWKWVKENQQIPYSEFTVFYKDLSTFIESQREEYFGIEKKCQSIANANNTLLDTLPNNLYNRVIGCERINFEYGFLSDKTDEVFKTKKEN